MRSICKIISNHCFRLELACSIVMKRIYPLGSPKAHHSGIWLWDNKTDKIHFEPHKDLIQKKERYIETNGYEFIRTITLDEEKVFRQEYSKVETRPDSNMISINDVRDLVLFLMPKEFLTKRFLDFMHRPAVHRLLHALIIYFEYFLRLVEFVLIRRDELAGDGANIQSEQSNDMKRIFSTHLSQYRLLVARNYSVILKGEGDMEEFYHMKKIVYISSSIRDMHHHEQFLAVAIQIVWITMHRRAYNVIEMEMNRLFRSEHFMLNRPEYLKFTSAERSLLYGRNNRIVNYRQQLSPLALELTNVADEDLPILWIGERKYRGTNIRIATIELEYIVPDTQLNFIDVAHGILGHPKRFYDTMLHLHWPAVRKANFSIDNDPYYFIRQPKLRIRYLNDKNVSEVGKYHESYFKIFQIYKPCPREIISKWLQRDKRILLSQHGQIGDDIYERCQQELNSTSFGPSVQQITDKYLKDISILRKVR